MKIRAGFVSNSSSSSFIIKKENLTKYQIKAIKNHKEIYNKLPKIIKRCNDMNYGADGWTIEETDKDIRGYAYMDNFGMGDFLRIIGVDTDDIHRYEYNEHYFDCPF